MVSVLLSMGAAYGLGFALSTFIDAVVEFYAIKMEEATCGSPVKLLLFCSDT